MEKQEPDKSLQNKSGLDFGALGSSLGSLLGLLGLGSHAQRESERYVADISVALDRYEWGKIKKSLRSLDQKSLLPPEAKKHILHQIDERSILPLSHSAVDADCMEALSLIAKLQGDLNVKATVDMRGSKVKDCTLLHRAHLRQNHSLALMLIELGVPVTPVNDKGETALLTFLKHSDEKQKHIPILEKYLEHNVDARVQDNSGRNAISYALASRSWSTVARLQESIRISTIREKLVLSDLILNLTEAVCRHAPGRTIRTLLPRRDAIKELGGDENFKKAANFLADTVRDCIKEKNWPAIDLILSQLLENRFKNKLGRPAIVKLLNSSSANTNIIGQLIDSSAPGDLIRKSVVLGARLAGNADNSTTLLHYITKSKEPNYAATQLLISEMRERKSPADRKGLEEHLVTLLAKHGHFVILLDVLNQGFAVPKKFRDWVLSGPEGLNVKPLSFTQTIQFIATKLPSLPANLRNEVRKLINRSGKFEHAYFYLLAAQGALKTDAPFDGTGLTAMIRDLTCFFPQGSVKHLIRAIESVMDNNPNLRAWHPNEAEWLALMNHQLDPRRTPQALNYLTNVATSLSRFMDLDIKIRGDTVNRWARIGGLTFSHARWRFDTEEIVEPLEKGDGWRLAVPSFFSQFGFLKVSDRDSDFKYPKSKGKKLHKYGPGYILPPGHLELEVRLQANDAIGIPQIFTLSSETFIEFRRAYLLASNPDFGTFIIRNSSPNFGRDTMPHPAYWSIRGIGSGFSQDDLLNFNKDMLHNEFRHILDRNLYLEPDSESPQIGELLNQLLVVTECYRRWKFDTSANTAWLYGDEGEAHLVGGYNSPGFAPLVKYLEKRLQDVMHDQLIYGHSDKMMPDLAFVSPHFPPWSPYTFKMPDGSYAKRLPVTQAVVSLFKNLINNTASEQDMVNTGVRNFFQEGFNKQAELVLLPPAKN